LATYAELLNVTDPNLDRLKGHREAKPYSLLIAALIERGGPMTLEEVAARLESAGIASAENALSSLKRCRPGRPPVYRDGDLYDLDPHDAEADLWAFRLGLRPPQRSRPEDSKTRPKPQLTVVRGPNDRLTPSELDEAWSRPLGSNWSTQRLILAVLDAHGPAMMPEEVRLAIERRTPYSSIEPRPGQFDRSNSPIVFDDEGRWAIASPESPALLSTRVAVRARIDQERAMSVKYRRSTPEEFEAAERRWEENRARHRAELASLRRCLLHASPGPCPQAVVIVDLQSRSLQSYGGDQLPAARQHLGSFDLIAGVDVRGALRRLDLASQNWRLAEIGPPQKTIQLSRRGRPLRLTIELMIAGTCGLKRAYDPAQIERKLAAGALVPGSRLLEAEARALVALYNYGRLHGHFRIRHRKQDFHLSAPWVHSDEPTLHDLMATAFACRAPIEVVAGSVPDLDHPWARAQLATIGVTVDQELVLVDGDRRIIQTWDVHLARSVMKTH